VSARRGPLVAFAALGVLWGGWAALLPSVQVAVGASKGTLGLALLGVGLGAFPAMLLAGRLIDRGVPHVLRLSFALLALASLLPALVGSPLALGAALVVIGACSGGGDVAMNARVAAIEADTGRPLMQLAHAIFSVGLMAGALLSGALRQAGAGRIGVLAAVAVVLLAASFANRHAPTRPAGPREPGRARVSRPLLLLGAACGAAFVVEGGLETWSALFLERNLDAGAVTGAAGPAAYAAAMATGRLLGHRIDGRIPDVLLLGVGAALASVGLLTAALAQAIPLADFAFFLGGIGISVAAPILFGAAGRTGTAAAVATVTSIGYLGFTVGPPVVGGIAQLVGLRGSFAVLAGVALLRAAATPRLALGARAAAKNG
jgi:hypothetical protein